MTNPDFNASLKVLLKAFAAHEDLRQQRADLPTLARSSHELHKARMATYHASR
jgi:hypothetical protein